MTALGATKATPITPCLLAIVFAYSWSCVGRGFYHESNQLITVPNASQVVNLLPTEI